MRHVLDMSRGGAVLMVIACAGMPACAGHRVPHVAPDESRPHITWEIRNGGETGDRTLVCGSASRSAPCVLPASAPDAPELVVVRVYLHAAAHQTSYLGVVTAPFVAAAAAEGREINLTVPQSSQPVASTLLGRVTNSAGAYSFSVRLDAVQGTGAAPLRIVEEVPVTVNPAASAGPLP